MDSKKVVIGLLITSILLHETEIFSDRDNRMESFHFPHLPHTSEVNLILTNNPISVSGYNFEDFITLK